MALERLGIATLIAAIQQKIESETGLRCYDFVEDNTESPFYFAELVQMAPANTKTAFRDRFTVWIHAIAEESDSSEGVYGLIQSLEEAMTEDISVPEGFDLVQQIYNGVQVIKKDETGEKHAVCAFDFIVSYGFKVKI